MQLEVGKKLGCVEWPFKQEHNFAFHVPSRSLLIILFIILNFVSLITTCIEENNL